MTIQTAIHVAPEDTDWQTVSAGRLFNHRFGFGTLDAYKIVEQAKTWKNLNSQTKIESSFSVVELPIPDTSSISLTTTVTADMITAARAIFIEHVTVLISIKHQRRGDISIDIVSPNGIKSKILVGRPNDEGVNGFEKWQMMSVAHWYYSYSYRDESPLGEWKIIIYDIKSGNLGTVTGWQLNLFSQSTEPFIPKILPNQNSSSGSTSSGPLPSEKPIPSRHPKIEVEPSILDSLIVFVSIAVFVFILGSLIFQGTKRGYFPFINAITRRFFRKARTSNIEFQTLNTEDDHGTNSELESFDRNPFAPVDDL